MSHSWSRWVRGKLRRRLQGTTRRRSVRARPMLELLEERLTPSVFNVNSLLDLSLAPGVYPDGTSGLPLRTLKCLIHVAALCGGASEDRSHPAIRMFRAAQG